MSVPAVSEEPTKISAEGISLALKFVERFLTEDELQLVRKMQPGAFLPLEQIRWVWDNLVRRAPVEMKAAIKGMIYAQRKMLEETGARSPADFLRVSNIVYQTFTRGARIGGREVVSEGQNELVVDDSTWPGCKVAPWFIEAYVRAGGAGGARGVRIEHLELCRTKSDRICRYRVRWSSVAP